MNRRRSIAALVVPLLLLADMTVSAVLAGPAHAGTTCSTTSTDRTLDEEERKLLNLINRFRRNKGKPELAHHKVVRRAATWFSRDMATKDYFALDHVDSNDRTPPQRLTWCGVAYNNWAENIYAGPPDAASVFAGWKASDVHKTNMLRTGVTSAGVARAFDGDSTYGWYWTLDLTDTPPVT